MQMIFIAEKPVDDFVDSKVSMDLDLYQLYTILHYEYYVYVYIYLHNYIYTVYVYNNFFLNTCFPSPFVCSPKTHGKNRRKSFPRRLETNDLDASPPHEGWRT